jgi:hypothetical protein
MSCPNPSPQPFAPSTRGIVVEMAGCRQAQLCRTLDGFYELALASPTKPGSAWGDRLVVHGKLQLSAERALETLAAIHRVCELVDQGGLPDVG